MWFDFKQLGLNSDINVGLDTSSFENYFLAEFLAGFDDVDEAVKLRSKGTDNESPGGGGNNGI